jgi:YesN/AraC family two-component response regulator
MKSIHFNMSHSEEEIIKVDVVDKFYAFLHHHQEMQISYLLDCEGDVMVEDYKGSFKSGDIFIIGSKQAHIFKEKLANDINTSNIKMYTVFLDLELFHKYFSQILEFQFLLRTLKKFNSGAKISGDVKSKLANFIVQTVESSDSDRLICFFNLIKSIAEIQEYEVLSINDVSIVRMGFDNQRLEKVLAFTKENLNRAIRLEEAAEVAFLTPESFCKYFKNKTGKTYIQYVNELRVNRASRFLIQEDFNLNEICSKVGFTNMSYFNRIFKKIKGSTPKEFQVSFI